MAGRLQVKSASRQCADRHSRLVCFGHRIIMIPQWNVPLPRAKLVYLDEAPVPVLPPFELHPGEFIARGAKRGIGAGRRAEPVGALDLDGENDAVLDVHEVGGVEGPGRDAEAHGFVHVDEAEPVGEDGEEKALLRLASAEPRIRCTWARFARLGHACSLQSLLRGLARFCGQFRGHLGAKVFGELVEIESH